MRAASAPTPPASRAPAIAPALLRWYDRQRRDLPWRSQSSPYRTLLSEFMLQQTVVATVVPFFERFVARFADLGALAAAPEDQVVALWSGLGYYARARNLHRAARAIVERHGGEIPDDETALRALPGIGPYTAAAVAAIGFGRRTFALDGNAARVIARLGGVTAAIDKPATRILLRAIGLRCVPARRSGDFAQAVMELGATVCLARKPLCDACPVSALCAARRDGKTLEIPAKAIRRPKRLVRVASARVRRQGRVLLVRGKTGLLAGTWMLPAAVVEEGGSSAAAARSALREVGIVARRLTPVGSVRHLFTHRDVRAEVFEASLAASRAASRAWPAIGDVAAGATAEQLWIEEGKLGEVPVSSFLRKQLALKRDKSFEPP